MIMPNRPPKKERFGLLPKQGKRQRRVMQGNVPMRTAQVAGAPTLRGPGKAKAPRDGER